MATIYDLTTELILLIAALLVPADFCAFRLASKGLCQKSYQHFETGIRGLPFLVAPHSLNALLAISHDHNMAHRIDTLRLGTEYIDKEDRTLLSEENREATTKNDRIRAQERLQNFVSTTKPNGTSGAVMMLPC